MNKKLVAKIVLAIMLMAIYICLFWVIPLYSGNIFGPRILNVALMHGVALGLSLLGISLGYLISEASK
jgi:hypothetical protein